ncbi:hypothetical protein, partial [Vibrio parahaemolyticus]|uniref:hypothetical protein n=1 Tax=Vibrio parahaemolyticus TaxID=670 RepID=UPI001D14BE00
YEFFTKSICDMAPTTCKWYIATIKAAIPLKLSKTLNLCIIFLNYLYIQTDDYTGKARQGKARQGKARQGKRLKLKHIIEVQFYSC